MAEYIERLKVLKEMHGSHTLPFFIGHRTDEDIMFCQMIAIVEEQPSADVVEVVRCKDCTHWGGVTFGLVCRKFSGENTKICMHADGYCSYGERRSE